MDGENRETKGNTVLLTVIGVATLLVALVGATFAYFSATITNNQKESVIITTAAPKGLEYLGSELSMPNIIPGAKNYTTEEDVPTFTVTNPEDSSVDQTYDLDLYIEENNFTVKYQEKDAEGQPKADAEVQTVREQLIVEIYAGSTTTPIDFTSGDSVNTTNGYNTLLTTTNDLWKADLTDATAGATDDATGKAATGAQIKIVDNQRIAIDETQTYKIKIEFKNIAEHDQNENQNKTFRAHIKISDPVSVK